MNASNLDTLTAGQVLALHAIVAHRLAWSRAEELRDRGVATEDLLALEAAGWVASWDLPRCVAWTLTPLGAYRVEHELVETGLAEVPRWDDRQNPQVWRANPKALPLRPAIQLHRPEFVVDRRLGPLEYLIDLEEPGRTTDEEDMAATLMGVPVALDKRARRKREAARTQRRRNVKRGKARTGAA